MDAKLVALYSHWCHADSVRVFVGEKIPGPAADSQLVESLHELAELSSSMSRLVVWYALVFVVVEGYLELKCHNEAVDALLAEESFVDGLRRFRNSIFHYQPQPIPQKYIDFLQAEGSELWVRRLHASLGMFFIRSLSIKEQLDELNRLAT